MHQLGEDGRFLAESLEDNVQHGCEEDVEQLYRSGNIYFMTMVSISQRLPAESHSTCRFKIYRKTFRTLMTLYRS